MGLLDRFSRPTDTASLGGIGLTAAATEIKVDDEAERARVRRGAEVWQRDAWNAFDDLEAISYPANYQANALSRIRLLPAVQDDPREPPIPLDPDGKDDLDLTDEERAAMYATLGRLGAGPLPINEIQRLIAVNEFVAGDCYLVGYDEKGTEKWDILSVEELVINQNGVGYARRLSPGLGITQQTALPPDAFIARLYQRHPRHSGLAYSSMRSVLGLCDELRILTDAIRATATSRIPAGILFLSRKMLSGPKDQTLTGQRDEAANDPTVQALLEHIETPIKNRRSASAVSPFLWFLDTDDVSKQVQLVEIGRQIDKLYSEQRLELQRRIGVGLDLPPEVLTGLGDVKYWNAQMIDQSTFKYHLEPDTVLMAQGLSTGFYQPHLQAMGLEGVNRFVIWYDPSPLFSHPNRTQDVQNAYDRIEVSGEAYRRALEIPETDAPTPEERADRTWAKVVEHMRTAPIAIPTPEQILKGEIEVVEPATSTTVGPTGSTSSPETPNDAGSPQTTPPVPTGTPAANAAIALPPLRALTASAGIGPLGPRLSRLESDLRLRLLTAASAEMRHTLEKAGNRLRSLANKTAALRSEVGNGVKDVDPLEVAGMLGPEKVEQLATSTHDLLVGAFATLGVSWETWVQRAQEQALAGIDEYGDLSDVDALAISQAMTSHRAEGWAVLEAALMGLAGRLLYEPHTPPPERGEWSDFMVPAGLIADAFREAGGGVATSGSSGLLSGSDIAGALDDAGLVVDSYVWVSGDPDRPFEAHHDLDGTEFSGWDDDALANDAGWPDVEFYSPNNGPDGADHDGCQCGAELNIVAETPPQGALDEANSEAP